MDLHRAVDDAPHHLGRHELRQRRLAPAVGAVVDVVGQFVDEQPGLLQLRVGVHQHPLHELVRPDGPLEGDAVLGELDGRVEHALRDPQSRGRDLQPGPVDPSHRGVEALAHLAEHVLRRHLAVGERELHRVLERRHGPLDPRDLVAGRVGVDEERGDAAPGPLLRICHREHQREVGDVPAGDEVLAARHDPRAIRLDGLRLNARGVDAFDRKAGAGKKESRVEPHWT